jgi:HD-GYP domain-containing protein (c-di-GMP phosphodiesterase class II)
MGQSEPTVLADASCVQACDLSTVTRQAIVVPIRVEGRCVGVLFTGGKSDAVELSTIDSKLATAAGQNAGIFLENAMLYEDAQDMFMGTLHALIASIDAKDTYTCGHSERVAWLSRQLAHAAGVDESTVERVYLSALVHDVGKIGVPEAVLCKPGRLTDPEFLMIKAHPEIGAHILRDIRQMRDLIPGVLHHHERYDGRGYPHALAGEAIPLFGRLICLADSFDAMSSNRTYRSALSHEKVLSEIERCAGTQFDPALAGVFLKLDFTGFFDMLTQHQNRQAPLAQAARSTP